jgi:2-hydroxy-6-oxonona-2,4-dienedioate hydrolase
MHAEFIDVGGARTRVLRSGTRGVPMLLVHGLGVSADMWVRLIDELGRRHQVVAVDMLGHGFTGWIPERSGGPERYLSDHVAGTMTALGFERFIYIGSSLGGVVGTHVLQRHPGRVKAFVLIGTDAPFTERHTLDPSVLVQAGKNAGKALANPSWENCQVRLRNICALPDTPLQDVALMHATIYAQPDRRIAYEALCREMTASIEAGTAAVAPGDIRVPTMVVCGRQDIRARIDLIRKNYRAIAGARLVEFDPCGHLPHLEVPDKLLTAIRSFIAETREAV